MSLSARSSASVRLEMLNRMYLPAFQILLTKFLLAPIRSRDRFTSWPGVVPVARRVDHIPQRFGHLAAVSIANQPMQEYRAKWHLPRELHAQHYHPRHPEEQDIVPCFHQGRRVELHVWGLLVRPPQSGKGPQPTRKPGVQNVLFSGKLCIVAISFFRLGIRFGLGPCHNILSLICTLHVPHLQSPDAMVSGPFLMLGRFSGACCLPECDGPTKAGGLRTSP
eukprot:scaffold5277_cov404-Prasinococcus_capsulatus_cf.AAC.6